MFFPRATCAGRIRLQKMETRRLGTSDLQITRIGFGAWAIGGGGWAFGWGPQDDGASIAAIHRALDLGVNWIDTAAIYGFGHSEQIVARAIRGRPHRPYVFTKCGLVQHGTGTPQRNLTRASLEREIDESLRRLDAEAIDLYQVHWPADDLEEGWETLSRAKEAGKLRYIGVSNFSTTQLRRCQAIAPVTSLQPPYSLINRAAENELLPFCHDEGLGVIVYSPMHSGLLSGAMTANRIASLPEDDWRRANRDFNPPRLQRNLRLAEVLKGVGRKHGVVAGQVAIAWTLENPAVTAAIVGARSSSQVEGVFPAGELRLDEDDRVAIEAFLSEDHLPAAIIG